MAIKPRAETCKSLRRQFPSYRSLTRRYAVAVRGSTAPHGAGIGHHAEAGPCESSNGGPASRSVAVTKRPLSGSSGWRKRLPARRGAGMVRGERPASRRNAR